MGNNFSSSFSENAGDSGLSENAAPRPRYDSAELFGKATEIVITHLGAEYVLRITRQNKLILNK